MPTTTAELEKWADEVEKMRRLDGRSEAEVLEALEYAVTDPFWQTNIRSTAKLRKNCETLLLQSRQKANGSRRQRKKTSTNRFHNLESHGYDYEAIVWGMNGECDEKQDEN